MQCYINFHLQHILQYSSTDCWYPIPHHILLVPQCLESFTAVFQILCSIVHSLSIVYFLMLCSRQSWLSVCSPLGMFPNTEQILEFWKIARTAQKGVKYRPKSLKFLFVCCGVPLGDLEVLLKWGISETGSTFDIRPNFKWWHPLIFTGVSVFSTAD